MVQIRNWNTHYPWKAIPALDVSANPPPANPVPSRCNSMMSFAFPSQTIHCFEGRTRVSVHVLQVTWPHGLLTFEAVNKEIIQGKGDVLKRRELFERCFLHEGHIGSGSSFFDSSDVGELAVEADEGV